ncbi:uncharacterized protein LOC100950366 [Otolemur garnettii]|uniref:uncharacterized protein LOC100950366 n=1 Tax=Otolemur garnettii TaxID=30611 RepID=UPI000C7E9E43|nr:uncharacterized protein LOC100950366 [Otolemur garnettii]
MQINFRYRWKATDLNPVGKREEGPAPGPITNQTNFRGTPDIPEPTVVPSGNKLSIEQLVRATPNSAGLDLSSRQRIILTPDMGVQPIGTGVYGPLPYTCVALLLKRSSTALKGLFVVPGVIDADYKRKIQILAHSPQGKDAPVWVPVRCIRSVNPPVEASTNRDKLGNSKDSASVPDGYTYCGSCAAHAYKQVDPSISHKDEFTIIPVLVGALSESKEQEFRKLFSKYLADPSNLFVVSSDFCHWGQMFHYSYYDESQGEIYRSIEHLDKIGKNIIEQLDPVSFSNYLKKYHNTICGRHPIGVLLNAITEFQKNGMNMSFFFFFLNYAQSSQCRNWQNSSVSYAAGSLTVH